MLSTREREKKSDTHRGKPVFRFRTDTNAEHKIDDKGRRSSAVAAINSTKRNKLDGFSGYKLTFDVEVEDFTLRLTLPVPADAAIPSCTVTSNTLQNETLICYDYACRYVVTKFLVLEPNNNKKRFEYPDDGDNIDGRQ